MVTSFPSTESIVYRSQLAIRTPYLSFGDTQTPELAIWRIRYINCNVIVKVIVADPWGATATEGVGLGGECQLAAWARGLS